MITNSQKFVKEITIGALKLIIAGIFIGYFKSYDFWIAILLATKVAFDIYALVLKPIRKKWILLFGMLLTCVAGLIGEKWGVTNGYWEYHKIENSLPLWLPFAWILAFIFLYKLESKLIVLLKNKTLRNKIILAIILALLLPAFGEIITIKMGVWTYYWPYQIFGVPLYAFLCLAFVHMLVYFILHLIFKKLNIKDTVFN
ncbi:hypothetical protein [Polaribacter tangerinus]|uniref:hypothetical protein n=1 Tax=Polaribacter tangerinus TaxID=1920034 RepID=UPI000B4BF8A9|nr:hypothetical protein [Polaribacter tangerinus]